MLHQKGAVIAEPFRFDIGVDSVVKSLTDACPEVVAV
jgi:hypothetical protein